MSLDYRFVRSQFSSKGFVIEKDGHDYYCRYYINGLVRTAIKSRIGGHSRRKYKTVPEPFLIQMYRSLFFDSKNQLLEFIDCKHTQEDYQEMLIKKGKIDPIDCSRMV